MSADDETVVTVRFATAECARKWTREIAGRTTVYRTIGEPYFEGVVPHAPIAVDCEKTPRNRAARLGGGADRHFTSGDGK